MYRLGEYHLTLAISFCPSLLTHSKILPIVLISQFASVLQFLESPSTGVGAFWCVKKQMC